ncbi:hypothetical protein [Photobacterium damselae]|uniref:hypothetical protein n=1 Tax=Photobacterium damselae TaxID=38293 RepID=UPI001F2E9B1C|nr:hypothetical protein [Photobacterium damselae]UKA01668.1 hypothetical protein IHC89_13680 [Photobacterium damselae subsp. damselae]
MLMNHTLNDDVDRLKTTQQVQPEELDLKEIFDIACELVAEDYSKAQDGMSLVVRKATMDDAKKAGRWKKTKGKDGYGLLPWEKAVSKTRYKKSNFTLAVCDKAGNLFALVSGKVDLVTDKVILNLIERDGSMEAFEGRAIPFVSRLMYQLAEMFECSEVRIMEPAEGLIERYKEFFDDADEVYSHRPPYIKAPVYTLTD